MEFSKGITLHTEEILARSTANNYEGTHPILRKDAISNINMYSCGKIGEAAYSIAEEKLMTQLCDSLQILQTMGLAASIIAIENSAGGMALNQKYSLSTDFIMHMAIDPLRTTILHSSNTSRSKS